MDEAVRREIVFPEPREELWRALTEADRLAEWFANEVELDPRPGGSGTFRWDDGSERVATVEEVDPDRRFAFRWRDRDGAETLVELTLEDDPGGTRLVVVETPAASASPEWAPALALRAAFAPTPA